MRLNEKIRYFIKHCAVCCSLCIIFAGVCVQNVSAVGIDYGVDIETTDALGEYYSYQRRVTPWVDMRFPVLNGLRLSIQGSAYVRFNPKVGMFRPLLDLDLFSLRTGYYPFCGGVVSYELGRINMRDTSQMIINQKIDGAAIHVAVPGIIMDFTAGYTGFQSYFTSNVMLSLDDFTEASERKNHLYGLGSRRGVFQWSTLFPDFIGRTDVYGDLLAQIDLRRNWSWLSFVENKVIQEEVNSAYVAAGMKGPLPYSYKWYYDVGGVVEALTRQTAKKTESYAAIYFNGGIQYYVLPNLQLAARVQYGTPNKKGISEYRPISYKNAGIFYEGGFNNLVKPELSIKWKISDVISIDSSLSGFITPQKCPKLNRDALEANYKYTELALGSSVLVGEDLKIRAEILFGTNNLHDNRKYDYSLRLVCNIGL